MLDTIKKYKRIIKIIATTATVAITIYALIPKSEKIKGIDTDPLETLSTKRADEDDAVIETTAQII